MVIVAFLINLIYNNDFVFNFPLRVGSGVEYRAPDRGVWFPPRAWVAGNGGAPDWKTAVPFLSIPKHPCLMSSASIPWDVKGPFVSVRMIELVMGAHPKLDYEEENEDVRMVPGQDNYTKLFRGQYSSMVASTQ